MAGKQAFTSKLLQPVSYHTLEFFRICFALVLLLQFFSFSSAHFLEKGILPVKFLFSYDWFPFITAKSPGLVKFFYGILLIAPLVMLFRKFFRIAMAVYLISFCYIVFLEQSYYNNHFYMMMLVCFFWLFYKPETINGEKTVPYWLLFLFQFQLFVVYFYGGIAKLNYDWIVLQEPARTMLAINTPGSSISSFLKSDFAVYYITYGGLIFDLGIGFLLFFRRTFLFAVALNILFHITNIYIFNFGEGGDIGIFPILMIAANILFLPKDMLDKLRKNFQANKAPAAVNKKIAQASKTNTEKKPAPFNQKLVLAFVGIYVGLQIVLPFRHFLISGNTEWTGQGSYFGWRMKMHTKKVTVKFFTADAEGQELKPFPLGRIINTMQINHMGQHAGMIYQFVQFIKEDLKRKNGSTNPVIKADIKVSFNGRPEQDFVDPDVNLAKVTFNSWKQPEWVEDLK